MATDDARDPALAAYLAACEELGRRAVRVLSEWSQDSDYLDAVLDVVGKEYKGLLLKLWRAWTTS